jgi:hypothetical protein
MKFLLFLPLFAISHSSFAAPQCDATLGGESRFVSDVLFNPIADKLKEVYTPIADSRGDKIYFKFSDEEKTPLNYLNGRAEGEDVIITGNDHGGFLTADGIAALMCQKVGHLYGGTHGVPTDAEGQADYYATARCLPNLFAADDNISIVSRMSIPARIQTLCGTSYSTAPDQAMCERIAMAGVSLARSDYWQSCAKGAANFLDTAPSIDALSVTPVGGIKHDGYASSQCRLNTFIAGALCNEDRSLPYDYQVRRRFQGGGMCLRSHGEGMRPGCSYP